MSRSGGILQMSPIGDGYREAVLVLPVAAASKSALPHAFNRILADLQDLLVMRTRQCAAALSA